MLAPGLMLLFTGTADTDLPSLDITSTSNLQIPVDYQIAEEKKVIKVQVVRSE